jgi:hypothetical protein
MPRPVTKTKLKKLSESNDPVVSAIATELIRARTKLALYKEVAEQRRAEINSFVAHMDARGGSIYDAAHGQGDDPYYYELDASKVESLVNILRNL